MPDIINEPIIIPPKLEKFSHLRDLLSSLAIKAIKEAIQSYNFEEGIIGWKISANGDVEFNNGLFRGALSASTIDIGGADDTSFHVDIDGNIWSGAATFALSPFRVSSAGVLRVGVPTTTEGTTIDGPNKRIVINDGSFDRILIGFQSGGF